MLYLHALFYLSSYCLLRAHVGYKQCCWEPLCYLAGVFFFLNLFSKHVTVNLIVNLIGLRTTHRQCTPLHVAARTFSDADWVRFAPHGSGTRAKQERERRKAACVGIPAAPLSVCADVSELPQSQLSLLLPPHHHGTRDCPSDCQLSELFLPGCSCCYWVTEMKGS